MLGAGVSGLSAAKTLKANGLCPLVIEARGRVGGRVYTDNTTFGVPVEIGAQFIHGVQTPSGVKNPVYALATQNSWSTVPFAATGPTLRNGAPLTASAESTLYTAYDNFVSYATTQQQGVCSGGMNAALGAVQAVPRGPHPDCRHSQKPCRLPSCASRCRRRRR